MRVDHGVCQAQRFYARGCSELRARAGAGGRGQSGETGLATVKAVENSFP